MLKDLKPFAIFLFLCLVVVAAVFSGKYLAGMGEGIRPLDKPAHEVFFKSDDIHNWISEQIKAMPTSKDATLFLFFYTVKFRNCEPGFDYGIIKDLVHPTIDIKFVLHNSFTPKDIENLKEIMNLKFECLRAPKNVSDRWTSLINTYGHVFDGVALALSSDGNLKITNKVIDPSTLIEYSQFVFDSLEYNSTSGGE